MTISKKCQYALLAVYELTRLYGQGPIKIAEIARRHEIPLKFLELILNELKHGGFVESRRGLQGGYFLAVKPADLYVGDIINHIEGDFTIVQSEETAKSVYFNAFTNVWNEVRTAIEGVFTAWSFQDLLSASLEESRNYAPDYNI